MEFTTKRSPTIWIDLCLQKDASKRRQLLGVHFRRKGAQCNASIKLSATDEFIRHNNDHTYPPSQTEVEITKVKASIKRKGRVNCRNESADTTYIIKKCVGRGRYKSAFSRYPEKKYPTCTRGSEHATKSSREEIPVLSRQYITSNGVEFLVFDSGVRDPKRIFVFASEQGRQFLAESEHWYADGTFKVCPELFFQLYTVYGQRVSPHL